MKFALLSSAGREIAQWRRFFHAQHGGNGAGRPPTRADAGDTAFDATEWSNTDWSDTQPEALALSEPIDATTEISP